jgi:tetratricopeptide (TPR) repeat protein
MRFLIAALLVCSVGFADEGDKEMARKRYEMGMLLFQRGKYADALRELEAAKAAFDRPEFDYNIGLCLAKLDRPGEAADALERFVKARPNDPEAPSIRTRIAELRQQLQKPPPAEPAPVSDERPHARAPDEPNPLPEKEALPPAPPGVPGVREEPLPPGEVAARAAAVEEARRPPPPPSAFSRFIRTPQGIATFAVGGFAVAAFLTSAITGGLAISRNNDYRDGCNLDICDHALYESARSLAIGTDVMLALGVAATVTTIVLAVVRPKEKPIALNRLVVHF